MAVGDRQAGPGPAAAAPESLRAAHARSGCATWRPLHGSPETPLSRLETGDSEGGEGGGGGSGDTGDAHGRAAAAGALRDAHSRTCGHESSSTACERRIG